VDELVFLVASAHLKLRLEYFRRHPELWRSDMEKRPPLTIPRPLEIAGMRSRLLRAQAQKKAIDKTGEDYDAVMDGIDEAHAAIKGHVTDLRIVESSLRSAIESMIDRSNGAPSDGVSDGRQLSSGQTGEEGGEPATGKPETHTTSVPAATVSTVPPTVELAPQPDAPDTAADAPAPASEASTAVPDAPPPPSSPAPIGAGAAAPVALTVNGVATN